MIRSTFVLVCLLLILQPASGLSADPRRRPVVAGNLAINPHHIIAAYRNEDSLMILIGRPGQEIQTIMFRDYPEANAVFNELWANQAMVKNPGDDDNRPLTRMMLKGGERERKTPALIANVDRVLAMVWDNNRRVTSIYLDQPGFNEADRLDITHNGGQSEDVMAAYKACLYSR